MHTLACLLGEAIGIEMGKELRHARVMNVCVCVCVCVYMYVLSVLCLYPGEMVCVLVCVCVCLYEFGCCIC